MSKTLAGKNVVVLGATGKIAYGATYNFLTQGATVVAVGRELKKLEAFAKKMKELAKHLILVEYSNYSEEKSPELLKEAVLKALPKGAHIDHVVSNLGFFYDSVSPTKSGVKDLKQAMEEGLYPNIVAVQAFVPLLKEREGSTFATVSGGFAHFSNKDLLPVWVATVKNGAMNSFFFTLKAETDGTKVRVANFCIHNGVRHPDEEKNQLGFPARDTNDLGTGFAEFAGNTLIGSAHFCVDVPEAEKDAASYVKQFVSGHAQKK